ncbi:MAG: type II toxin-antitoxin system PemK/MazF family toxin [Patescibacteria group bacterium]
MVRKKYIPGRGDIIWLDFSTTKGHEQGGRRPSLVLSPEPYNKLIGLVIVCPITQKIKNYSFEVPISVDKVKGVILSDHVKSVAYRERKIKYIDRAPETTIQEVVQKIRAILDPNNGRQYLHTKLIFPDDSSRGKEAW